MKEKLCTYANSQLPGGDYWEPEEAVKSILLQLKPNNDLCESILGLNDYLTSAIPNLHQMSKSNLIQTKKKKTIDWLCNLSQEKQERIIEMAVKRRAKVSKLYKEEEARRSEQRHAKLVEVHSREVMKQKTIEKLSNLHLITSSDELMEYLLEIDSEEITSKKKVQKKLGIIREQIMFWRS